MNKTSLLFLTIMVEGYVVLASELLAMRQLIPFVGSGVEIMAIVISGVLLPLAIGYHAGGRAWKRACALARARGNSKPSIRRLLMRNLLLALMVLSLGLSYLFLENYFEFLNYIGIRHRLLQASIYAAIFLVPPTFLLGQTVPLVSNYFSRRRLSEITGNMLFFSTAGSFLGSIFSTLVLMTFIGVHNAVIFTLALLCILRVLLSGRRGAQGAILTSGAILIFVVILNNGENLRIAGVVSDDAYNIARVIPVPGGNGDLLMLNRSPSSFVDASGKPGFDYIKYIQTTFIDDMPRDAPRDVLIIGAGGFTLGLGDDFNHYNFVDIDPNLKKIAEDDFLRKKLGPNKNFIPSSARAFLVQDKRQYDLIVVDVYQQKYSIPMECMTKEFLRDVKTHMKENGILVVNMLEAPDFRDKFAVRYDRTFSQIFPVHSRQIINPPYNPWLKENEISSDQSVRNALYLVFNRPRTKDETIYTDDKNTYSLDRP